MTGLAQVFQPPDTDMPSVRRRFALDLDYVSRANRWLDLRILSATAARALGFPATVLTPLFKLSDDIESKPYDPDDPGTFCSESYAEILNDPTEEKLAGYEWITTGCEHRGPQRM